MKKLFLPSLMIFNYFPVNETGNWKLENEIFFLSCVFFKFQVSSFKFRIS